MIRILFATLALATATSAELAPTITWQGGENIIPSSRSRCIRAKRMAIHGNTAFLTIDRSVSIDVPATLVEMSLEGDDHTQYPFPNLEMQKLAKCSALQDVTDILIDRKGLLWVLDAGLPNAYSFFDIICAPKIVAFDIKNKQSVRTIDLSDFPGKPFTLLSLKHIVVEYKEEDQVFVYVSDTSNRKIYVISNDNSHPMCVHWIDIPTSDDELEADSSDITINMMRNSSDSWLLVNDEWKGRTYFFSTKDIQACSELPKGLLKNLGSNDDVIIGNSQNSTIYLRKKDYTGEVYSYDALDSSVELSLAYEGSPSALPTHIVPYDSSDEMWLLESNNWNCSARTDGEITHELKPLD